MGPWTSRFISQNSHDSAPRVAPEAVPGLEEPDRRLGPYVLYSYFVDNLKKPHGSVWIVKTVVWNSHRPHLQGFC
jgi:hypothetical protein